MPACLPRSRPRPIRTMRRDGNPILQIKKLGFREDESLLRGTPPRALTPAQSRPFSPSKCTLHPPPATIQIVSSAPARQAGGQGGDRTAKTGRQEAASGLDDQPGLGTDVLSLPVPWAWAQAGHRQGECPRLAPRPQRRDGFSKLLSTKHGVAVKSTLPHGEDSSGVTAFSVRPLGATCSDRDGCRNEIFLLLL